MVLVATGPAMRRGPRASDCRHPGGQSAGSERGCGRCGERSSSIRSSVETDSAWRSAGLFLSRRGSVWLFTGSYWSSISLGSAENSGFGPCKTLSRPVRNSNPVENRAFWYWVDPSSTAEDQVEVRSSRKPHANRDNSQQRARPSRRRRCTDCSRLLKTADPVASDMGHHRPCKIWR